MKTEHQPTWRLTTALRVSIVIHAGALVMTILSPSFWVEALCAVLANHAILTGAVFWPRSRLLGANMTHLPADAKRRREVALTFDDGPDPIITPKILEILDQHDARASFFCIAERVEAYPELAREIVRRGHTIENHSYGHAYTFALHGWDGLRGDIAQAQEVIKSVTGTTAQFFRAPMGFRSPFLMPVLEYLGLCYVSWTRRGYDAFVQDPEFILGRLQRGLAAGDILLLHDGRSYQAQGSSAVVLQVLPRLLQHLRSCGLRSVTLPDAMKQDGSI